MAQRMSNSMHLDPGGADPQLDQSFSWQGVGQLQMQTHS